MTATVEPGILLEDIRKVLGALVKAVEATSEQEPVDIVVPISKTAEFIKFVKKVENETGVRMVSFGHAGDGNVHLCAVRGERSDEEWREKLHEVMSRIYGKAYELGGVTSGEHGIGVSKREYYLRETPREILDRLAEVTREDFHQYSITWGAQNFREALAEKQSRLMGRSIDPNSEIVVTCGSTEAIMAAMMTVVNPGDKVIVFSPFYENYGADAILSGAEPIYVPLIPPEFGFDRNALEQAFAQNPRALILCNPSNPCGKVFTYDELKFIAGLAEKYDVFVITDEVYEHIIYKPNMHVYFSSLPGMYERTISCSSLSKTYSITVWQLGYIIAPPHIIDAARKVHDFLRQHRTIIVERLRRQIFPVSALCLQQNACANPTK